MKARMSILIIASAMLAIFGAACITRTEGSAQQPEPQIVGTDRLDGSGEPVEPPGPPITIIDNMDPDECSFIHNINACFTDGQPPAGIALGDYMDVYFKAKEELSRRTGEDHFGAKIKSVERVNWNNSSLGKPEPGSYYLQVITPGFKLVLDSDGAFHTYHTSLDSVVFVESN